ncbi:hypothetical protein C8A00DRAFT_36707 [Chaetomidium leptoderma]|uniref:Uncharacterized protein n=1 Tax=Chaetomidium leptoderma TaxID=669021 RepID=A0AAN6VHL4_9PEZI|nr:hypothetical protein C8A00DRAFT_36707 [Chaetomidium leptoderma]
MVYYTTKDLCLYLLNYQQCPGPGRGCWRPSHDTRAIRASQKQIAKNPCNHGPSCLYLIAGNCCFHHPEEDHAGVQRRRMERVAQITRGLRDVDTVVVSQLLMDGNPVAITQDRDLASFNRVSHGEVAVPGSPPRFTPPTQALEVQADSDNKAILLGFPRYTHLFEPMLRSVEVMQPTFNLVESADVVSSVSNLRKLFDVLHVRNRLWKAHRFDLEMRGAALLLSRWTEDPELRYSLGRGASFEKETCRYALEDDPVLKKSASHHGVVAYSFGGLRCVVQSEVDGYYCDCDDHSARLPVPIPIPIPIPARPVPKHRKTHSAPLPIPRKNWGHHRRLSTTPPRSSPPTAFAALTLDDPGDSPAFAATKPRTSDPSPTLRIHHCGDAVPSACRIEIKTHNADSLPSSSPEAPLYFARRTKLFLARHKQGHFAPRPDHVVRDQTEVLKAWEREEQATLRRVVALLRLVRERMMGALKREGVERASLVVECDGAGTGGGDKGVRIKLCEREEGRRFLPL